MTAALARRTPGRPVQDAQVETREALLDAAVALFAEQGVAATTSAQIAARAGVRMTECLPYPLIIGEKPMALRRATELMVPATVELRPAVETSSIDLMKRIARIAPHVAILNLADVRMDLADGSLCFVPLLDTAAHQAISVFHRAAGAPEVGVSVMAREIENVLQEAQASAHPDKKAR